MIIVTMTYHVIQGKQQVFEEKFAEMLSVLQSADGHRSSTLWKAVSDNASYLIMSEWSDEPAYTDFTHGDAFRTAATWGPEDILSARPQHKIYGQ